MKAPVGKSGPGSFRMSWPRVASGCLISSIVASMTSERLCGGMLVAMPTAMPAEPLTSRFGKRAGSTCGSRSLAS
jgi:hypothetical protein